jgi:FkbH-like protein
MFDIDKYESKLHTEEPVSPAAPYKPASDIAEMSLLFWGEHCVECAAPSCYQSCDLYQSRPDKRCRRFVYGAFKNANFPSLRGYGVEVSFKKWAKIEAKGNLSLRPVNSVLRREKLVEWGSPFANAVGKLMGTLTRNDNWNSFTYIALERLSRRMDRKSSENRSPDAFLLEVYNPSSETVRMQLSFSPTHEDGNGTHDLVQLMPSFVTTVEFANGYSCHEIQASMFRSVTESGKPFKISLIPEADNNARLVFLTADLVKFTKIPAAVSDTKKIKCVVWDLDNTLWNGTLIEGDQVVLRPAIDRLLRQLDERGILLSIVSKNDYASTREKLKQFGVNDYFLYPQINWKPKSVNIQAISERLNIGLDTFAFVDDNPFELDQVGRTLPDVLCVNATEIPSLFSDARFQGSSSADSRRRRQFYKEAIAREEAQEGYGTNYTAFLASCGIKLEIAPYSPEESDRVAELVQRTNQLNFSGHKYSRVQLNEILANPRFEKYVLKSSDKYGSYGTVGFSIVERGMGIIQIRDFMLSCRVQGKYLEQAFFHHLVKHHNPQGATVLWVNFHETARNKPAQQVLESLSFRKCNPASDRLLEGVVHTSPASLQCDFIQVHCFASGSEAVKTNLESVVTATPPHP